MASGDSIGPLHPTRATLDSTYGSRRSVWPLGGRGRKDNPANRPDSQGPLAAPREKVLPLVQARVMARTAAALDLDARQAQGILPDVVDPSSWEPDVFLGRLMAAQHTLSQRSPYPAAERPARLELGMKEGVAEALELLQEARALDGDTWQVVGELLGAFQHKLFRVLAQAGLAGAAGRVSPTGPQTGG